MMEKNVTFSPSEFAFGYSGCKRCYYDLKVKNLKVQTGFPSIFSKIDTLQKKYYHNQNSSVLKNKIIPDGIIKTDYSKLQTSKILHDNKGRCFQLRGKIDEYIVHKNFYSIIDFKVTNLNDSKTHIYKTQLISYALMFENPNEKSMRLFPVKKLGILCFEPNELKEINQRSFFEMSMKFYEIQRDDKFFINFITGVLDFLEGDVPSFSDNCSICYLKKNKFS